MGHRGLTHVSLGSDLRTQTKDGPSAASLSLKHLRLIVSFCLKVSRPSAELRAFFLNYRRLMKGEYIVLPKDYFGKHYKRPDVLS